jgi:hypothetical protein
MIKYIYNICNNIVLKKDKIIYKYNINENYDAIAY